MNVATWLYILFTQSKGYSDIKICSSYKKKWNTSETDSFSKAYIPKENNAYTI